MLKYREKMQSFHEKTAKIHQKRVNSEIDGLSRNIQRPNNN